MTGYRKRNFFGIITYKGVLLTDDVYRISNDAKIIQATDNYDLYYKVIVKDFSGNTLSEEVGDLYQAADGTWWIA